MSGGKKIKKIKEEQEMIENVDVILNGHLVTIANRRRLPSLTRSVVLHPYRRAELVSLLPCWRAAPVLPVKGFGTSLPHLSAAPVAKSTRFPSN